jgi:hypothetical protein
VISLFPDEIVISSVSSEKVAFFITFEMSLVFKPSFLTMGNNLS